MPTATARWRLATAALPLLLLACGGGAATPGAAGDGGPIVLVTFSALRADVVGGLGGPPGLTPHLDALIRQADWSSRAIAASSRGEPSLASLWTGLRPWQHQVLNGGNGLSPDLLTLAEALAAAGYSTAGYPGGPWFSQGEGFAQGFQSFDPSDRGRGAAVRLRGLSDGEGKRDGESGRQFVWIHIPEPQAPYVQRRRLLPRLEHLKRLGGLPRELPARIRPLQLEPYFDPGVPLPDGKRRRFWAMYLLNVAWADEKLGRLVEALRASGQWDRTLLAVVSLHGEELGEKEQIGHGGNLCRRLVEVPLIVKLPAGGGRIAVPKGEKVAAARLWATLVEAAGGPTVPAAAPSLFRPASWPALSELYRNNGTNLFSLVEGDRQLLWESRFAPSEPDYYKARYRTLAGEGPPDRPDVLFERLSTAFAAVPPLTGLASEPPRLTLERWSPGGPGGEGTGSEVVSDPQRTAAMARRLAAAWGAFVPVELPPQQETKARGAGAGGSGLPF